MLVNKYSVIYSCVCPKADDDLPLPTGNHILLLLYWGTVYVINIINEFMYTFNNVYSLTQLVLPSLCLMNFFDLAN